MYPFAHSGEVWCDAVNVNVNVKVVFTRFSIKNEQNGVPRGHEFLSSQKALWPADEDTVRRNLLQNKRYTDWDGLHA